MTSTPDAVGAAEHIPRQPAPSGPHGGNLLEVTGLEKHFPITRGVIF